MTTPRPLRNLARRNAKILAVNGLPPAPKNPIARTRGTLGGDGRLQRQQSSVERKRVTEEVGCTVTSVDWKHRMRTTQNSHLNSGPKLQHASLGDGSLRTHRRAGRG